MLPASFVPVGWEKKLRGQTEYPFFLVENLWMKSCVKTDIEKYCTKSILFLLFLLLKSEGQEEV